MVFFEKIGSPQFSKCHFVGSPQFSKRYFVGFPQISEYDFTKFPQISCCYMKNYSYLCSVLSSIKDILVLFAVNFKYNG